MAGVDFAKIEKKWQGRWAKEGVFCTQGVSSASGKVDGKGRGKDKYYVLEMFPYPSGSGLHMGHAWNYTIGDILARFKMMQGFNVLHPMGYDALGLPAENAAIEKGKHPEDYTKKSVANFTKQMKSLGLSYDWSRRVNTSEPEYYKWDQWIFLKMLEKGLAYQKESEVNWCKKCNTVLANEQVHDGKCWRHSRIAVETRKLKQWFLKTTEYADELYGNLENMDWPERTKAMQRNWIGRSHGTEIDFLIESRENAGAVEGRTKTSSSVEDLGNVVIVHGCPGDKESSLNFETRTYDKHWIPWTREKLLKKGIKAEVPLMPEPWAPNYESWKKEFDKLNVNENSVLVGHSCGCSFLVRWLGDTKKKIKKLVLVAPWKIAYREDGSDKDFYEYKIDECVRSNVGEVVIFTSNNEEKDGKESVKLYEKDISGEIIELKDHGHFTMGGMGTEEFPELLDEIVSKWPIFTTRPDTIFGVTFMVVSAQHPRLDSLVTSEQRKEVDKFLKKVKSTSEKDIEKLEKEGVFSGSYAINPANGEKVPVWIGNFVVADYGCGMVMAVPAHDQRDFEFAKKYGIEIRQVVAPYFCDENNPPREGKKNSPRTVVQAIVRHPKDNKVIQIQWKKFPWNTFVIGGAEEGESLEEAVKREVYEETGYKNIKSIKRVGFEMRSEWFAEHKDENRYAYMNVFVVELSDLKKDKISDDEMEKHVVSWVGFDKMREIYGPVSELDYICDTLKNEMRAYVDGGRLINSAMFNEMDSEEAKENISGWLKKNKVGRRVVNFKLRDWGISRQRYWGTPIPIVHCEKCGAVPVPENDLPVKLPKDVRFGKGNPLESNKKWLSVKCPKCKGAARRESDTMDTFVNSSWYFLRYCDPNNAKKIFDEKKVKYWCPVDTYIGGAEHACMHLIYSRFYVKFLRDLGLVDFDEPAMKLFHQGMLHGENGEKMSKSKGNGVLPEVVSEKYGIDTARFFLSGIASPDKNIDWSEKGINGSLRFVNKVFDLFKDVGKDGVVLIEKEFVEVEPEVDVDEEEGGEVVEEEERVVPKRVAKVVEIKDSAEVLSKLNETIRDVGGYINSFDYRPATIRLRELFDLLAKQDCVTRNTLEKSLKLLSPFCPHICEELWEKMGGKGFVSVAEWPKVDESRILKKGRGGDLNEKIVESVKYVLGKVSDAKKVYVYVMPFELKGVDVKKIAKEVGKEVGVFAVNDSGKYDPEGKAKRAKPGKVSVYVE